MLQGKCKENFEKWYFNTFIIPFDSLPIQMQYGVYVQYFDSQGMQVYIKPFMDKWGGYIDDMGSHLLTQYLIFSTLEDAMRIVITEAGEIYNDRQDV